MTIDTHLHVWDRTRSAYAWLDDADPALDRAFGIDAVRTELRDAGIDSVLLVQADDTRADTEFMLECALDPLVAGIVASAPFDSPHDTERELERLVSEPAVRGIRVLNHDRPDPRWMLRTDVTESVRAVGRAGYPLDVVAVTAAQLDAAVEVADAHPELQLVLDHLGKPPVGGGADRVSRWTGTIAELAMRPNVVAKLSGLYPVDGAVPEGMTVADAVAIALDHFGSGRLMVGTDWPVSSLQGGLSETWSPMMSAVHSLAGHSLAGLESILDGCAASTYRLVSR